MAKKKNVAADRLNQSRKSLDGYYESLLKMREMCVNVGSQLPADRDEIMEALVAEWPVPNSVRKAASFFNLNLDRPSHRFLLLIVLADACFGRKPSGRRRDSKFWHSPRLAVLFERFEEVMRTHPDMKQRDAARYIKRHWREDYSETTAEQIRQNFAKAKREWLRISAALRRNAEPCDPIRPAHPA
jgi:hypothetical protein